MKFVIIAHQIFPHNSPRAFRAIELAKAIKNEGNDVVVYSVLGKYDYSQFMDKTGIIVKDLGMPRFYRDSSDGTYHKNLLERIIFHFTEKYLSWPSMTLMPKIKRALTAEEGASCIITIAMPYVIPWSVALIKKNSKKKLFNKWISDCGDPFMGNPMLKPMFYFKYIEKLWCKQTDYIVVPVNDAVSAYYSEFKEKIRVIPQGFNFDNIPKVEYHKNKILTFSYSGVVYKGTRDPSRFLEFLCSLDIDFRFIIYTRTKSLFNNYQSLLKDKLIVKDYVDREELLKRLGSYDFLVNFSNDSSKQVPSKLIDYALTNRPIINISSSFTEEEKDVFTDFCKGNYSRRVLINNLEDYNIKNVVSKFLSLASN